LGIYLSFLNSELVFPYSSFALLVVGCADSLEKSLSWMHTPERESVEHEIDFSGINEEQNGYTENWKIMIRAGF
jgi:hypothetical protein